MGLLDLLHRMGLRRKQRRLLQDIDHSPIRYSNGTGTSLEDPIVISGAALDLEGTAAVFAWLIKRHGTLNVDWRLLGKSGHHDGQRDIDIYVIQAPSGEQLTFYFDLTESYGKFPG